MRPWQIHAQADSVMLMPAKTRMMIPADHDDNSCTIQHGHTSSALPQSLNWQPHQNSTIPTTMHMMMKCENSPRAVVVDNNTMGTDPCCAVNKVEDISTSTTVTSTTGGDEHDDNDQQPQNKNNNNGSMPLALDDPLRANLLVVAHICLGELWTTDRNMVEPALKRLSDLCTEKKTPREDAVNNRMAFQLIKGYAIIVEVMNLWRKDRKIQYLCCLVILNVADGGGTAGEDHQDPPPADVGTGVVEAVVTAMQAFPAFFPVQLCGCGALTSLCRSSKQNAHQLVQKNLMGIETIMSAIQRYPHATNLQVWARWCLQSILQWEDFRKAFLDAWVRSTLDDALFKKLESPHRRPVVPSP
jgi:hypothetical protein